MTTNLDLTNVGIYAWSNMNHGAVPSPVTDNHCTIASSLGDAASAHVICETDALGGHVTAGAHYTDHFGSHTDYNKVHTHDDRHAPGGNYDFDIGYKSSGLDAHAQLGTHSPGHYYASGGATFHW